MRKLLSLCLGAMLFLPAVSFAVGENCGYADVWCEGKRGSTLIERNLLTSLDHGQTCRLPQHCKHYVAYCERMMRCKGVDCKVKVKIKHKNKQGHQICHGRR